MLVGGKARTRLVKVPNVPQKAHQSKGNVASRLCKQSNEECNKSPGKIRKASLRWIDPQEKENLPTNGFGTQLFDTSQAQKSKPSLVVSVENFFHDLKQ